MHLQLANRPAISDLSAHGLALSFCETPRLEVVATLTVPLGAGLGAARVEVLAASHRVRLLDATGGVVATEQVACLADRSDGADAEGLPERASHVAGRHRLVFGSSLAELDARGLAELASRIRGADGARTLSASFPGHADALTSVEVLEDGWETWHLYPGARPHALHTRTRVSRR